MSNTDRVMDQVLAIMEKMAGNPNSRLDATNFAQIMNHLTDTVVDGYKKVAELKGSTSLTVAEAPASVTPASSTGAAPQPTAPIAAVDDMSAGPEETPAAAEAPAEAPRAAAKQASSDAVKSPAPKKAEEEPVAEAEPLPPLPEDEDEAIAESMIREHGSAVAAFTILTQNRKRGRKTAWHKIIEARADAERRAAPKNAKIDPDAFAAAIAMGKTPEEASAEQTGYKFAHISRVPIMDPEKAITHSHITCLIDGEKRTMLARHIRAKFDMSPEEYIAHLGLRSDYPMTSASYRNEKRRLAEVQKLGKRTPGAPVETPAESKRRTRTRKAA